MTVVTAEEIRLAEIKTKTMCVCVCVCVCVWNNNKEVAHWDRPWGIAHFTSPQAKD